MRNLQSGVLQTRTNVQATRDHSQCVRLFLDLVSSIRTAHLRSSIQTHTISLRSHHKSALDPNSRNLLTESYDTIAK